MVGMPGLATNRCQSGGLVQRLSRSGGKPQRSTSRRHVNMFRPHAVAFMLCRGCFWYAKRALRQVEEEMERREQEELAQAELKAQQLPKCDRDGTHTPGEAAAAPEAAAAALEGQHAWQQQQQQGECQGRQRTSQELHQTGQQGVLQQEQERQGMTEQQLQAQPTHDLSFQQQQQQLQQRQEQQSSIALFRAEETGSKESAECRQSSAGAAAGAGIQIASHAAREAPHMAPSVDCTARAGSSSPCIDSGVPPERGDGWETSTRSARQHCQWDERCRLALDGSIRLS